MSKETSAKIAKLAAMGLKNPKLLSWSEVKKICASALAQREAELAWPMLNQLTTAEKNEVAHVIKVYVPFAAYSKIRSIARKAGKRRAKAA